MSKQSRTCLIRGDGGRAVRGLLERIGEKWPLLVVATLDGEPLRFGELQQRIPEISQRMLTRTLRHLERDGLITRTSFPEVPPRVVYALTPLGRTLLDPAVALAEWATVHNADIEASRSAYDTHHP